MEPGGGPAACFLESATSRALADAFSNCGPHLLGGVAGTARLDAPFLVNLAPPIVWLARMVFKDGGRLG